MSFKEFLISKVFVKNLSLAVALLVGIIMILLIWLNIYTRHGQARPVPDFFGLSLEETAKLAKKSKLRYDVVDSVYTNVVPAGCVAEQNPIPGFKVKKRRRIRGGLHRRAPVVRPSRPSRPSPRRVAISGRLAGRQGGPDGRGLSAW